MADDQSFQQNGARIDKLKSVDKEREQTTVFNVVGDVDGCLQTGKERVDQNHLELPPSSQLDVLWRICEPAESFQDMEFEDLEKSGRFEGFKESRRCPLAFCFSSQAAVQIFTIIPAVDLLLFCLDGFCHFVPHRWVSPEIEATSKEEFHPPLSLMDNGEGILRDGTAFLYRLNDFVDFFLGWGYLNISSLSRSLPAFRQQIVSNTEKESQGHYHHSPM